MNATRAETRTHVRRMFGRALTICNRGYVALVLMLFYLPVAYIFVLSFNKPMGRYNVTFNAFTLDNWLHPCAVHGICESMRFSLGIAALATIVATILGTLAAYAMTRFAIKARGLVNVLIFAPMATPEVVMGSSLLTLFVGTSIPLGVISIVLAHVMFCFSFVVVVVKARLQGLNRSLEEAACDLYSSSVGAFCRVTLPLAAPGIAAAGLLAFALSFDDFIITDFNSGSIVTFPMFVWGAAHKGVPPQVQVFGAAFFTIAVLIGITGALLKKRN